MKKSELKAIIKECIVEESLLNTSPTEQRELKKACKLLELENIECYLNEGRLTGVSKDGSPFKVIVDGDLWDLYYYDIEVEGEDQGHELTGSMEDVIDNILM